MAQIDDYSDAQLRRLYRDVMARGDPFKKSRHAHKSQEDLVIEMDAADEVMTDMSAEIARLEVALGRHARRWCTWRWFTVAQAVVIAGLVWRIWP